MEIAKRLSALTIGVAALYIWWHTNGLPNFIYLTFDIGKRSPLPDRFLGFLSIIAMIFIIVCCMLVALAAFSYFFNPASFKQTEAAVQPFKLMLAHRVAGLAVIACGLLVWFLAYQIPELTIHRLYSFRMTEPLRTILGMTSVALMFVLGIGGLIATVAGGGLALCPSKMTKSN